MSLGLDPDTMDAHSDRKHLTDAVNRYLEQADSVVLDVGNPVGRPSLDGIEEEGYICVNPGNNDRDQDVYSFRTGDGLNPDHINTILEQDGAEEATYMVVHGVSQIFDYYVSEFGHVEHNPDRDERRRDVAAVYAENLADMDIDSIVMVEQTVDPDHENGYAMGDITVNQLDHFQAQLDEEGFSTVQYTYEANGPVQYQLLTAER